MLLAQPPVVCHESSFNFLAEKNPHGKIGELCLFGKFGIWFRNVMKEEIVFIIPMRSYYPMQSHETSFEHNLIYLN